MAGNKANVITGGRARVIIKGNTVGYISGVNVNVDESTVDIEVLDEVTKKEFAHVRHDVDFSINYFRVNNKSKKVENTLESLELSTNSAPDILKRATFDCEFIDVEGKGGTGPIVKLLDCAFQGGSGSVDARGVWSGSMNFKAREAKGL